VLRGELPTVPVSLGAFDQDLLLRARELVVSPGVSLQEGAIRDAVASGVPMCGDIELFARAVDVPVVAVTGSNGKSTVTTLVGEMARVDGRAVRVGGNLGPPALDLLDEDCADLFVLELSSFQLETTHSLRPAAAAVLNISPDHMDRYDSLDAYAQVKQRVFNGDGVMVLNLDDPMVLAMRCHNRRTIGFTLERPQGSAFGIVDGAAGPWLACGDTPLLPVSALKTPGRHMAANALASLALGTAMGISLSAMRSVLRRFTGLAHRCQLVSEQDGIRWYNDSKATNTGATIAALESFGKTEQVVLIAGGDAKDADFSALRRAAAGVLRAAVLIGRDADALEDALEGTVLVVRARTMEDAVAQARGHAQCGDAVLLSPACASLDMFSGYEERGQRFVEAIRGGAH
jgi:UDP-N-acetylmuramoylalanine--D-glutamate ligase